MGRLDFRPAGGCVVATCKSPLARHGPAEGIELTGDQVDCRGVRLKNVDYRHQIRRLWIPSMNLPYSPAFLAAIFLLFAEGATSQDRVALVVGNNTYPGDGNFSSLQNCVGDATLIKTSLEGLGFRVFYLENASRSEMDAELAEFEGAIPRGGTAVFYFAGHGIEFEGKNYLMGSNAKLMARSRLGEEAMDAETFASAMLLAGARSSFLFLDCCREVPNDVGWLTRGIKKRGLAEINIDGDIIIAYAAKPGQAALDGTDGNSPYAKALARWLPSGLKHGDLFDQVRMDVHRATAGAQRTWESGSFLEPFFFQGAQPAPVVPAPVTPLPTAMTGGERGAVERYFESIHDLEMKANEMVPTDSMQEGVSIMLRGYEAVSTEGLPAEIAGAHLAFVATMRALVEQSSILPKDFASGQWYNREALSKASEQYPDLAEHVGRIIKNVEKFQEQRTELGDLRDAHSAP
jgi:hypothetical protein